MFLSSSPYLDDPEPDPAVLAFVKCHVTSPVKWEVLRVLAGQDGAWIRAEQLARSTHRQPVEVVQALKDLTTDGVVEMLPATAQEDVSYRLPSDEPTSVVLHRLIDSATHSQELRSIIAAHLQHLRQQTHPMRTSPAVA
jgi:DNA-binding IclR family transcriptional regulator